jgi:queuine tRNA-ribosyltransferase
MVLDECPAFPATETQIEESLMLSMRWTKRPRDAFGDQSGRLLRNRAGQHLPASRRRSIETLQEIGFHGYAVGGLAVGESLMQMFETPDAVMPA